jgi:hypothetical protein
MRLARRMGKLNYRASENHDNDEEKSPSVKGAYRRNSRRCKTALICRYSPKWDALGKWGKSGTRHTGDFE